jgi:hypothetical protein
MCVHDDLLQMALSPAIVVVAYVMAPWDTMAVNKMQRSKAGLSHNTFSYG